MVQRFVCFAIALVGLTLLGGCGAGDVLTPGEEVVVDRWIDPVDVGGEYLIKREDIKLHTPYLLDTGEYVTFDGRSTDKPSLFNSGDSVDDPLKVFIGDYFIDNDGKRRYQEKIIGTIVSEGPPVVSITIDYLRSEEEGGYYDDRQVTPERSHQDHIDFAFHIKIDRVLDYNLPIYLEYQTQDREEFGSEVKRVRFLTAVLKGKTYAKGIYRGDDRVSVGSNARHERASISILPYTEMEKIDLPAELNIVPPYFTAPGHGIPTEDRIIPDGHTFRPYRIASSSYVMGVNDVERNW